MPLFARQYQEGYNNCFKGVQKLSIMQNQDDQKIKDDTERLRTSRIRLNRLKRKNQSLQDFAINTIIKNIALYIYPSDSKLQLITLSGTLRADLLHKISHTKCRDEKKNMQFTLFDEVIPLLLSNELKCLKIKWLMSYCFPTQIEDNVSKMVQQIAVFAPKLHTLDITDPVQPLAWNQQICDSLISLQQLKKLELAFSNIPFPDVLEMCRKITSLLTLNIRFVNLRDPLNPLEIRESLSNLSVLKIILNGKTETKKHFMRCCIEHLPNLEIVGSDVTCMDQFDILHTDCQLQFSEPSMSKLRHAFARLEVGGGQNFTSEDLHLQFPNITHLKIHWKGNANQDKPELKKQLLRFSKVEFLILDGVPSRAVLDQILNSYGKNLLTFRLENSVEDIQTYKRILYWCPILEKLVIDRSKCSEELEPLEHYANLKTLRFIFPRDSSGIVSNILSAPNLERVVLWGKLNVTDLARLSHLIMDKKILQNLEHLEINFKEDTEFSSVSEEIFYYKAVNEFVKNCFEYLPVLQDVNYALPNHARTTIDILPGPPLLFQDDVQAKKFRELGDEVVYRLLHLLDDK